MRLSTKALAIGVSGGIVAGMLIFATLKPPAIERLMADGNPHELYQVVTNQISAFQQHDYPAAYEFAASGIRDKYPLEKFAQMVRQNYPQLQRPGYLNFATTQFVPGNRASVLIYLTTGTRSTPAIYTFVKERGQWKIEGVELIRAGNPSKTNNDLQT